MGLGRALGWSIRRRTQTCQRTAGSVRAFARGFPDLWLIGETGSGGSHLAPKKSLKEVVATQRLIDLRHFSARCHRIEEPLHSITAGKARDAALQYIWNR